MSTYLYRSDDIVVQQSSMSNVLGWTMLHIFPHMYGADLSYIRTPTEAFRVGIVLIRWAIREWFERRRPS